MLAQVIFMRKAGSARRNLSRKGVKKGKTKAMKKVGKAQSMRDKGECGCKYC